MSVVVLPPLAAPVDQLWHLLLDLDEVLSVGWTIVGGQMVLLHALEHGQVPPQISQDGDLIADIRADPRAIASVVKALHEFGFASAGIAADGVAIGLSEPHHHSRLSSTYSPRKEWERALTCPRRLPVARSRCRAGRRRWPGQNT